MATVTSKRIHSIDQLRGLVMIIMALDHTRDLFHETALTEDPLNLDTTTPFLFFTRWITHLCAPTFVFLSGVSIYLQQHKMQSPAALQSKLLKRGFWLILLELTVVNFGIWFNIHFNAVLFQVIGAIGIGFIIMAFLQRITPPFLLLTGLVLITINQYLNIPALSTQLVQQLGPAHTLIVAYPPLPWLAIMLIGFGMGPYFKQDTKNTVWFASLGLILLSGGIFLRAFSGFGDPNGFTLQKNTLLSGLSFIRVEKYPPSLLFTMFMLGIALLLFALLKKQRLPQPINTLLEVYGSVPLFYYVLHWYLIHSTLIVVLLLDGYSLNQLNFGAFGFGRPLEQPNGYPLAVVYLVWICAVALLYPACVSYRRFKQNNPENFFSKYL
ncbi:MAG: DUF1624 domain-containing protein [Flavipsychrobacter sp.]|nr:DUF1624 domain-containing protein [Flavipsychrobacter sp.]